MAKKIIISGGGTGGHIFPAIAIANALKQEDPAIEILFVGAMGKMEMEKVPQAGYAIEGIHIAGFNRTSLLKNIGLPFKLIRSFFEVRQIFKKFHPDAVVGVGGYASFPLLRYAQSAGIPSFIHESNAFAGKANMMLGKKASKIFVASEGMEKFFPADKLIISGNPVRQNLLTSPISRKTALEFFGLQEDKITVLAMGGSLGARSINQAIAAGMDHFEENHLQLIWQTGKSTADQFVSIAKDRPNIWVNDFITEMNMAYAAADLVISRAGAMAVTEISLLAKPAIFVPFPLAAEDHQTHNAMSLVQRNAAMLIKDADAKHDLIGAVVALAKDASRRALYAENCKNLAKRDADQLIAKEILKTIQ